MVGYEADQIIDHVGTLASRPEVAFVYNPAFTKGSVLSLLAAKDVMTSGETYWCWMQMFCFTLASCKALIESAHQNCYLIDQDFVAGDEPVKIAINKGQMVEFRKALPADLEFDTLGESVGFFKFNGEIAAEISQTCAGYNTEGSVGCAA